MCHTLHGGAHLLVKELETGQVSVVSLACKCCLPFIQNRLRGYGQLTHACHVHVVVCNSFGGAMSVPCAHTSRATDAVYPDSQ